VSGIVSSPFTSQEPNFAAGWFADFPRASSHHIPTDPWALLGANLDKAIPNSARIGYTGTPIDKTERVFGDYIDKYTMRQSIEDGVTLEIVYEGRTHNAEVIDKGAMDTAFQDVFSDYSIAGGTLMRCKGLWPRNQHQQDLWETDSVGDRHAETHGRAQRLPRLRGGYECHGTGTGSRPRSWATL
jgi:hypothetical protein